MFEYSAAQILALLASDQPTPAARVALGRQLADLHDPRPGVTDLKIDWVDVPAGKFLMGSNPAIDPEANPRELPQHTVALPAFRISRYPITVAQYEPFVNGKGYAQAEYWPAPALKWKGSRTQPEIGWNDPRYHVANQPVIGVNLYEARAYCRWLSEQLGMIVRIPSEAEWEKAARATDGRLYPYGNELDESRFADDALGIDHPCAVGLFPSNASPYGVLDLCGNVFEWTTSLLRDYPYLADDGREAPEKAGSRIFRGGSFNTPAAFSRCAFRSHFYPHAGYDWVGFRVCTSE